MMKKLFAALLHPVLLGFAGLIALVFVASFIHHGRVNQQVRRYAELFAINGGPL